MYLMIVVAAIIGSILSIIYSTFFVSFLGWASGFIDILEPKRWYSSYKRSLITDIVLSGFVASFIGSFGGGVMAMLIAVAAAIASFVISSSLHLKYKLESTLWRRT